MDRPAFQYASKEAAHRTTSLAQHDNQRFERMAKYVNGAVNTMVQLFRWECEDYCAIIVYTDIELGEVLTESLFDGA